jgi:hypothetical protein
LRIAEPGDGADDRSRIEEHSILQLLIGTMGRNEAETARVTDRNASDPLASFNRKTHGHDCLQCNWRLTDEAAVEPTQPTAPSSIRLVQFIRGVLKAWCRNSDRAEVASRRIAP